MWIDFLRAEYGLHSVVVLLFPKYSPWHPVLLRSAEFEFFVNGWCCRSRCILQLPSACLDATAPNCANVSRRPVNDCYCDGSCHPISFDHSPKLIEFVVYLQFAGGQIGQFGENESSIACSVASHCWQRTPHTRILESTINSARHESFVRRTKDVLAGVADYRSP